MSENSFKEFRLELKEMRKAQADFHDNMLKVLVKLEHIMTNLSSNDFETRKLRKSVHEHGNKFAEVDALKLRIDKLESHEETREKELKDSFKERDQKHFKLSLIVYIGIGMAMAFEFMARFL